MSLAHLFKTALRHHHSHGVIINSSLDAIRCIASICHQGLGQGRPITSLPTVVQTAPPQSHGPFATRGLVTLREAPSPANGTLWNMWRSSSPMQALSNGSINSSSTMSVAVRHMSGLTPRFVGGKLKPYSAFKERFKMTGGGRIRYMRPGHVHKRHNKGRRQLQELSEGKTMHPTYEKTMKRLGFVMRRF